jgi:hypothetical protein
LRENSWESNSLKLAWLHIIFQIFLDLVILLSYINAILLLNYISLPVLYHLLTDYLQVALLALHRVRVNLTHVPSPVGFSNFPDMKEPYTVIAVRHRYPMVFCYHVAMDGQYGLGVHSQPCDLKIKLDSDSNNIIQNTHLVYTTMFVRLMYTAHVCPIRAHVHCLFYVKIIFKNVAYNFLNFNVIGPNIKRHTSHPPKSI